MARAPRLFGTDGIRGAFGAPPLDEATVRAVGHAVADVLGDDSPTVLLGGDTRESTPQLGSWLGTTLAGRGCRTIDLGTVPTPGVAHLVPSQGASAGVVISASHNPYPDNGIKLIGADGFKFSDELEERIEQIVAESPRRDSGPTGDVESRPDLVDAYRRHLVASTDVRLDGLSVVLDTGHGAAFCLAGPVFEALGARTRVLHDQPDGRNVNDGCGSTAPEIVAERVEAEGADLGFAFDGDADRVILVDHEGRVRDGDEILFLWGRALQERGELDPPPHGATSMSNLGLERALRPYGIAVERCDVGDRAVVRTLREQGLLLGGEQSGHIIHLGLGTTGDGLLTAVQIAAEVRRSGRPLADALSEFVAYPQLLRNVRVARKPPLLDVDEIRDEARAVEERLGSEGRLVLRYSGTEPLARIMIEGPEQAEIESMAADLAKVIEQTLG